MKTIPTLFVALFIATIAITAQNKPEIIVQLGHSNFVNVVAISPDGKYILSGAGDKTLKLWDVVTGKEMRTFLGHDNSVTSAVFSPDGAFALSCSWDKSLKLWDVATGKEKKTLQGHSSPVSSVAFSLDGTTAISGSWDQTLKLWNIKSGEVIRTFSGTTEQINTVAFSPNGQYVLSGSDENTLKLWDIANGNVIRTFSGHTGHVLSVAFSPDGRYALSGSEDKKMKLWSVMGGEEIKTFSGHSYHVLSVAFSPDGKYAVSGSGSMDCTIKLWNIESGSEIRTFNGHDNWVSTVKFSPEGKNIVSGSWDNTVKLWNVSNGNEIRTLKGKTFPVRSVAYTPDGKYALSGSGLYSGSPDNTLKLWDVEEGKKIRMYTGHTRPVNSVAISSDGKYVLSGSNDNTMKLWDIDSEKEIRTFSGHSNSIFSVAITPDGKHALSASSDESLRLWNVADGKEILTFSGSPQSVSSAAFSPDGKYVISVSKGEDGVRLWNVENGKEERIFSQSSIHHYFYCVAFSPDGKFVLSGLGENTIKLWNVSTGKEIRTFSGHSDKVTSVAFSPDGKYAVSGSSDNTIKIWDVENGREVKSFSGHSSNVTSVAFSPKGNFVLSGSDDSTVRIWDVKTGAWTALTANSDGTQWFVFTNDGYWDSSPNGGELVAMVSGMSVWNIDQFAFQNNRPDIILQHLGSIDKNLMAHYAVQYQKRLKKLGITEAQLSRDYYAPTATITDIEQNGKICTVKFQCIDTKYKIKSYNIFVNDVPLFGAYGKDINGQSFTSTEKIELSNGANKIEASCLNVKGAESYRALTYATYNKPITSDLYFIGFGVSQYQNPELNLEYADKDVNNLSDVLKKMKGKFNNVYVNTFVNDQATIKNLKKAKELLMNAKTDDTFILFIAGHGMHDTDKEATYYFLTYNTNLKNLKNTAASFETIEDLLQGIAPRNKLFLMDACESGEIDDDVQNAFIAKAGARGLKSRGMKQAAVNSPRLTGNNTQSSKRAYLYQKDRYIYNDLARRSGAIVFSSSKGGEFSYERSDIQNGLFTKSIIDALTSNTADKNNDGIISTDELRSFVSIDVAKSSNDLQHPVVDRDNIFQKFGFTIAK